MSNVLKLKKSALRVVSIHADQRKETFPSLDTMIFSEDRPAVIDEQDTVTDERGLMTDEGLSQTQWKDMPEVIATAQKESYDKGYEQAMKDCEEQYAQRLHEECQRIMALPIEQMHDIVAAVQHAWKQFSVSVENVVIMLSLAAAERVIKKEVQMDDRIILNQIREGLKRISGVEHLKLRLHPDDEKIVRQSRTELLAHVDSIRDIVVEPDESVSRGGCIIESESGSVDATVETQTKKMAELLTEARALFK